MAGEVNIIGLIGDFYQFHTYGNEAAKKETLERLQSLALTGQTEGTPFLEYYNDMFSGRSGFNAKINTADYPKESIIRELFQNAMGCRYSTGDIKIVADFQDGDILVLSYNEMGFSMEDILYYLGFGMNNGDTTREGRFGIGAKSVFLNVESLAVRSNSFSFKICKDEGDKIKLESFDLNGQQFKGTRLTLKLEHGEFERIKDNFISMTEKKGDYLNMVELCFAFNRKKVMDPETDNTENPQRTLNLAVMINGKISDLYRVQLYRKDESEPPKIRFYHNNKSLVDFLCYEYDNFVYLIPYAVANTKRESVIRLLMSKYNYFSTYELTGYIGAGSDKVIDEKLSAFFVSVPNTCITASRTGIRFDMEETVYAAFERDISAIIKEYNKFFTLDIAPAEEGFYVLRPRSYAFEFFNGFMNTSRYAERVKDSFVSGISIKFPGEQEPALYEELRKQAVKSSMREVPQEYHEDGSARREYVDEKIETLKKGVSDENNYIIYAGYDWENENKSSSGRVYRYEIVRNGNPYVISSDIPGNDYELYTGFSSVIGYRLPALLVDDCVTDEDALERIFSMFDEVTGGDYTLAMKYYRIHFDGNGEKYTFEISKIQVHNIKNAIDTVKRRERRFMSHQNYLDVESLMMNSFTQGKDAMTFLREIREQGGEVGFTLDFNNKYRFLVYGKQFMIPSTVTNKDLIEIVGDMSRLMESGVLKDRTFDFGYTAPRYNFDTEAVAELMMDFASFQETESIMNNLAISNMKFDGVALLTEKDKVVCVKKFGAPISEKERKAAFRYVILRDDLSKEEFSSMLEYIISGAEQGILLRFFNRIKDPSRIIPDQLPLRYRRAPVFSREEFDFAKELYNSIKGQSELDGYKSYFSKDINGRLYGYGTCCACCGEAGEDINAYDIVDLIIDVMTESGEKHFNFALYLCRNHIADSNGWLIKELSIGGMDPYKWLDELEKAENVPPEFFICSLKYVPHMVYDITVDSPGVGADVVAAEPKTLEFRLTPLMAAKWVIDNQE